MVFIAGSKVRLSNLLNLGQSICFVDIRIHNDFHHKIRGVLRYICYIRPNVLEGAVTYIYKLYLVQL